MMAQIWTGAALAVAVADRDNPDSLIITCHQDWRAGGSLPLAAEPRKVEWLFTSTKWL